MAPVVLGLLTIAACSDGNQATSETSTPTTSVQSDAAATGPATTGLPPLLDPASLAEADAPVELPQLIGLSEDDARRWAEQSGFAVETQDEAHEGAFAPTVRIVIEVVDGVVVKASAG